jgi:hypothetical protein
MDPREIGYESGLDSIGSECGPVEGSSVHGNEPSGRIQGGKFREECFRKCSVTIVARIRAELGFDPQQGQGIFIFTTESIPTLGPTQLPVQSVPGAPSGG